MVREPDAATRPTPQDNQLMSKHRVLSFKPCLRLEWRGQDGQSEAEQPDHPASLGDSITASHSDEVFGTHRPALRVTLPKLDRTDKGRQIVGAPTPAFCLGAESFAIHEGACGFDRCKLL